MDSHKANPPLSELANTMTGHFHDLGFHNAPTIQPALLHPFLGVGDFGNISGPPGCGKTRIAADVVLAAIHPDRNGKALGGLFQFDQDLYNYHKVAILDAENSPSRWESILSRKMRLEGLDSNPIRNKITHIRSFDVGLHRSQDWERNAIALAEALYLNQVRFIIGDTLAGIWAPEDINSSGWVHRGYMPFRATCQKLGITCLMLTHTKRNAYKGPDPVGPIGSSAQEGQADVQIMVSRTKSPEPAGIQLIHRKSRRSCWIQQGASVKAYFTELEGYRPQPNWEKEWPHNFPDSNFHMQDETQTTQGQIIDLLVQNKPNAISAEEIASLTDIKSRTVRYHLKKLKDQFIIKMVGSGSSIKWELVP